MGKRVNSNDFQQVLPFPNLLGHIGRKGQVTSFVMGNGTPVQRHVRNLIDGAEMKNQTMIFREESVRQLKTLFIAEGVFHRTVIAGKRRLRWIRHQNRVAV